MPITATLITSGAIAAGKGIQSLIRARRAKKEIESLSKGLKDPRYNISPEIAETYAAAKNMPISRNMPGYGAMQNMMSLQTAGAMGDIQKYGTGLDAVAAMTNLGGQNMMAQQELGVQNAQTYQDQLMSRSEMMMRMAPQMAQERMTQYEQNVLNPFLRSSAAISALREKRYQEADNAFNSFAQAASSGVSAAGNAGMFGGGGGDTGTGSNANPTNTVMSTMGGGGTGMSAAGGMGFPYNQGFSPEMLAAMGFF